MEELINEILNNDVADRHSYFQLKYFVIGKEPTIQAQLWRCITELRSRKETIDAIFLEIEETKDNIELMNIRLDKFKNKVPKTELHLKTKEIELRRINRRKASFEKTLVSLQKKLKNAQEEACFFAKAFQSIEKIEKYKGFDNVESQEEYWNQKLAQDLEMKILLGCPVDVELMKTILSLGDNIPIKNKALSILNNIQTDIKKIEGS